MRRIIVLISALALTGCAAKHYVVCVQGSAGAGCSHEQFSMANAKRVARLMATQPIAEDVTVWVEKKGTSKVAPANDSHVEDSLREHENKL